VGHGRATLGSEIGTFRSRLEKKRKSGINPTKRMAGQKSTQRTKWNEPTAGGRRETQKEKYGSLHHPTRERAGGVQHGVENSDQGKNDKLSRFGGGSKAASPGGMSQEKKKKKTSIGMGWPLKATEVNKPGTGEEKTWGRPAKEGAAKRPTSSKTSDKG